MIGTSICKVLLQIMFLVQAIADFEPQMAISAYSQTKEQPKPAQTASQKREKPTIQQTEQHKPQSSGNEQEDQQQEAIENANQHAEQQMEPGKRARQPQQEEELQKEANQIKYIGFKKGDKIVTRATYDNGWWYGNTLKAPDVYGYFPSNFVQVGATAPPPEAPPQKDDKEDWMQQQLKSMSKGPVKSEYYQGITGYKMVKIDDKNKNILKGNYVKFDSTSGLAKVPIKSQDPTAKAIRQMGYYFDINQWCQEKNNNPQPKSRPDPKKKRKKRLNLILFGEDKIKQTKK